MEDGRRNDIGGVKGLSIFRWSGGYEWRSDGK